MTAIPGSGSCPKIELPSSIMEGNSNDVVSEFSALMGYSTFQHVDVLRAMVSSGIATLIPDQNFLQMRPTWRRSSDPVKGMN